MATPRGSAPLRLHQRCELASYGQGEILFVGQTSFSAGLWAGIALDEPIGKHDGVVQGKRYFTASPGHGIFVRPSQLRVIDDDDDDGEGGDENDEANGVHEQEASPDPNRLASRRTSATSSRTPSRLMSSPAKPAATSRPSSAMPPPVAPSASAALRAARTSSPSKASAALSRTSSNRSPTKTPARATPVSRTGTASGRASVVSRPSSTLGRPTTTSPQARTPGNRAPASAAAARTPGTATVPRTAARAAVQAAKAPDSATARAGLRPVVKSRLSMAPPTSARQTSPTRPAQTPSASTSARIGAGAGASRLSDPLSSSSSTAKKPLLQRALTSASTSRRGSEQDLEQGEDLLAMDLDDAGLDQRLVPSSSEASHLSDHAELAMQQEEGLVSPSLRKSATVARPDYMSLSSGPSMTALSRNTGEVAAMQRELEELRVKVKIAEKKREEDRERVRDAERIQMDSEQFLAVKPKMQAKQQELQDQLKDLHKMEKDWTMQKEELERQMSEMTDQLEIATLDREVAEEKAEGALEELRLMTDKVEELQVDIEVLREENAMYEQGPVDDKDKLSVGYVQLEKQNERLKDALLRLRDITSETDAEHRKKIAQLEKDLNALDDLQVSYEGVCGKLETSDALLEDLKIQLDDALGAEEMLEQLTERNMALGEKVQELTVAVEELESLKELNDELEETHLETEKQLQEEIDLKEMQLREHGLRTETLEANIVDYESTFGQFRELVMNLQNELETARKDGNAVEAGRESKEDQAMLNLNLKLQSSTIKSQAKTIELEIGKLQAQQAKVNLEMISPYLPKEFFENDKDACDSLLFFRRVAAKSDMIKTIVEGNHDIASNLVGVVDESLIKVCKMRRSLAHFVVSARQISAVIQLASIPTFLKAGRMYKELISIERRIDHFIEQLREEALNEEECGKEYSRFVGLLEDFDYALVEQANDGLDSDLAAKEVGSAILLDLDLDTIAAALGFSKQSVASLYNDLLGQASGEESDEMRRLQMMEKDINEGLFTPIQDLINTMRATKVPARKLLRRLSSLSDNSEAVKMEAIVKLPGLGKLTSQLVEFSSMLVNNFSSYTNEARLNKTPLDVKALLAFVREAAAEALDQINSDSPWSFTRSEATRLNQTVGELLGAATEQENVMKISGPFPWTGRVEEIKQMQSQNVEMQRIVTKQAEDLKDMYRQTKVRDELLQENNIKIERLARQLQKSKDELSAVASLKSDLSDTTKRMKAYEDGNSALQGELEQLQREYERVVKERGAPTEAGEGASARLDAAAGGGSAIAASEYSRSAAVSSSSLEVSYLVDQLEAVRGALRHCRLENSMLKSRDVLGQLDSLPPLTPIRPLDEGEEEEGATSSKLGLPKQHKRTKPSGSTTAEGRKLVRDLLAVASSPRVITLTSPSEGQRKDGAGRAWTPLAKQPLNQYREQQKQRSQIQQQINSLQSRMNGLPSVVSLRA